LCQSSLWLQYQINHSFITCFAFLSHFSESAADLSPLNNTITPPPSEVIPYEFTISQADVECKPSQINEHKAPGSNGLPNWLLRDFPTHLADQHAPSTMCQCAKESFRWKEANVIPVPKVHPPRATEADLWPISLTAAIGKVLESFVRSWILERVSSRLDDCQYGALKQRSTTHALVDILHHWHAAVDRGQSVHAVFVDFAKAFDHVDHTVLVSKLVALELPDVTVDLRLPTT